MHLPEGLFVDAFTLVVCRRLPTLLAAALDGQVARRVASSGISQEPLSLDHIRHILNRLIFDAKVGVVGESEEKL
jgi:hypothetical protein